MRVSVRRWMKWSHLAALVLAGTALTAQSGAPKPPDPNIQDLRWRNIGNANLVGRISSIDALDSDWAHVIVGSAAGGVFKSTNGGIALGIDLRQLRRGVDRRRQDQSAGSEHHLGRHRRRVRHATPRRGATASTSRPTADTTFKNVSVLRTRSTSARSSCIQPTRTSFTSPRPATSTARSAAAASSRRSMAARRGPS